MTVESFPCPWCDTIMIYNEDALGWHCPYCATHKHKLVALLNWDGKPMSEEEREKYWQEVTC